MHEVGAYTAWEGLYTPKSEVVY